MPRWILFFLALIIGSVVGWFLLAGFCGIAGLSFGNVCGHNAYMWLSLFIPLGIFVTWFSLDHFRRAIQSNSKSGNHGDN